MPRNNRRGDNNVFNQDSDDDRLLQSKPNVKTFKFSAFDPSTEEWRYYLQRFELELSLHGLSNNDEVKRNLLLKWIGTEPYRLVVDHFMPDSVINKTYTEIEQFLGDHYQTATHYLSERLRFSMCFRQPEQSINSYISQLRSIAIPCKFGKSLHERIRDQIVCGIQNISIQQEIFRNFPNDKPCILNDLEKFVNVLENAEKQSKVLFNNVKSSSSENFKWSQQNTQINATKKSDFIRENKTQRRHLILDSDRTCLRCGLQKHSNLKDCRASQVTCHICGRVGHFQRVCTKSGYVTIINKQKSVLGANNVCETEQVYEDDDNVVNNVQGTTIHFSDSGSVKRLRIIVHVNKVQLNLRYDPGADRTVICSRSWRKIGSPCLTKIPDFCGYPHANFPMRGECIVTVKIGKDERFLAVAVAYEEQAEDLFGLDWIEPFDLIPKDNRILIRNIEDKTKSTDELTERDRKQVLSEFKELLCGNGKVKNFKANIKVKENCTPVVARTRLVPFAWKKLVEDELNRLIEADIIEPVDTKFENIEWASALVLQMKESGKLRLCGDFKNTINPNIVFERYPLPTFEEAVATLSPYKEFSVIDLKDAFHQIEIEADCQKYFVITTHRGYFRYKRLPFGITVAPLIFQRFMDAILKDIEGVTWYQDDIALGGRTRQEHLQKLRMVLARLQEIGLRTQPAKLNLLKKEVTFLGYRVSSEGIYPQEDKIKAIRELPEPNNAKQLRSFLGSINYYARFLPSLQQKCAPLHRLLKKDSRWVWTRSDQEIFHELKRQLSSDCIVVHFQSNLPIVLTVDACEYGLGAVLQHKYPDGSLKLICAASRTLDDSEKNYSSIDREALAIMFGVSKFERYLLGHHFTLQTDHKPLTRIFGEKEGLPKIVSSRLTRWAINLSNFHYNIEHIPGANNTIADLLSRLPLKDKHVSELEKVSNRISEIHYTVIENAALTQKHIANKSFSDLELQKVTSYVKRGWPELSSLPINLHTYHSKRDELQIEEGMLLWHDRIVVPTCLRKQILHRLHETHPGALTMKNIAKSTVWWPNCNKDIEDFVDACDTCQKLRYNIKETPLSLWSLPDHQWDRIHIDYTGPYHGKMWFVVIDAYSRWMEIFPMCSATSESSIKALRTLFARYGLPSSIVSDNASIFTSENFKQFVKLNGIHLILTTPYHSRSNGIVERAIKTFKFRYGKSADQFKDPEHRLQAMLFVYRNSTHSSTGRTPSEMFLGRNTRTFLHTLLPDKRAYADRKSLKMKLYHDRGLEERTFEKGDAVWFKRKNDKEWSPAVIEERTGDLSYRARTSKETNVRLHADHLRPKRVCRQPNYLKDYMTTTSGGGEV